MREIYLKNLNAKIYIDDVSIVNEQDFDGKIRVYDSNKKYLDYIEIETFERLSNRLETNLEHIYNAQVSVLESVCSIKSLLHLLGTRAIVCHQDNLHEIELQYRGDKYFDMLDEQGKRKLLAQNDYINIIGEYWIYNY